MTAVRGPCSRNTRLVYAQGPLRVPLGHDWQDTLRAYLRRGDRVFVLDLTRVTSIDAAGVGELVRAHNLTAAASGSFAIVNANAWVREMLDRAGLSGVLNATCRPAGGEQSNRSA
jgi:anti-anti-sigma factor